MRVVHQMRREKYLPPIPTAEPITSIVDMPFVCLFFMGVYWQVAVTNHSVLSFQNLKSLWKSDTQVSLGSGKIFPLEKQDR